MQVFLSRLAIRIQRERSQDSFALMHACIAFASLEILVVLQGLLAYHDSFLTVSQMVAAGTKEGLPFLWHLAMWGDLLLISPLAAYIIGRTISRWHLGGIFISCFSGLTISVAMHILYTFSDFAESHVQAHHLTCVGLVHSIYMGLTLVVFTQFLLFTDILNLVVLRIVSVILVVHVLLGTHFVLGIIKLFTPLDWYTAQPLKSIPGWLTFGVISVALLWRNIAARTHFPVSQSAIGNFSREHFLLYKHTAGFVTAKDPDTVEGYLKFLDLICGLIIGATYFFKLLADHKLLASILTFCWVLGIF